MAEENKKQEASSEKEEVKKEEVKKEEVEKEEPKKEEPKEEESEEVEVPDKFKDLVESIEEMKVSDLAELVKILEKKFGVSAAPQMVASSAQGGAPEGGEQAEEKSEYNIELIDIGKEKIKVIKVTRDVTEKGLKEAKDLVDSAASSPQAIKENVKKEEAEEIKKKFEEAGAKVELK